MSSKYTGRILDLVKESVGHGAPIGRRVTAARVLGMLAGQGVKEALQMLIGLMNDREDEVKREALQSLSELYSCKPEVFEALTDESILVVGGHIFVPRRLAGDEFWLSLLNDKYIEVCMTAALHLLSSSNAKNANAAAEALKRLVQEAYAGHLVGPALKERIRRGEKMNRDALESLLQTGHPWGSYSWFLDVAEIAKEAGLWNTLQYLEKHSTQSKLALIKVCSPPRDKQERGVLFRLLYDPDAEVAAAAASALVLHSKEGALSNEIIGRAITALLSKMEKDGYTDIAAPIETLIQIARTISGKEAHAQLMELMCSSSVTERVRAAAIAAAVNDWERLGVFAKDEHAEVRRAVAAVMLVIPCPENLPETAIDLLFELLSDKELKVREMAIKALERLGMSSTDIDILRVLVCDI